MKLAVFCFVLVMLIASAIAADTTTDIPNTTVATTAKTKAPPPQPSSDCKDYDDLGNPCVTPSGEQGTCGKTLEKRGYIFKCFPKTKT